MDRKGCPRSVEVASAELWPDQYLGEAIRLWRLVGSDRFSSEGMKIEGDPPIRVVQHCLD